MNTELQKIVDYYNKSLTNIVWHIERNRKTLGDKRTLDDVLKALKNIVKD